MKTQIVKIKGDWEEVVSDCRATVGKPPLGHEPSTEFKRKILISEHSPIRDISVKWKWHNIKSWVATHWVRHKWECFVKTQRTDRTGIDRDKLPQDAPVDFTGDANAQALIDTMRKRLCHTAAPETREYAEDFKRALRAIEPELSDVLVPNCCYRGFCPEMQSCGMWENIAKNLTKEDLLSWEKRYGAYNERLWYRKKRDDGQNTCL
nr:MAG TPA: thymidylate synthase, flavin-dependent [Caudoviricetes sp.]